MKGDDKSWIGGGREHGVQLVKVRQEVAGCGDSWCARSRMSETLKRERRHRMARLRCARRLEGMVDTIVGSDEIR